MISGKKEYDAKGGIRWLKIRAKAKIRIRRRKKTRRKKRQVK